MHRADGVAVPQHALDGVAVAHMHEHEIRGAGDEGQAHRGELGLGGHLALDGGDTLTYLARSRANLQLVQERLFHRTGITSDKFQRSHF